jgi:hypothetical protein
MKLNKQMVDHAIAYCDVIRSIIENQLEHHPAVIYSQEEDSEGATQVDQLLDILADVTSKLNNIEIPEEKSEQLIPAIDVSSWPTFEERLLVVPNADTALYEKAVSEGYKILLENEEETYMEKVD